MEAFKLVMPEHLNHYGYLFGGNLLQWVDEFAYIAANREFPGHRFVTVALDEVVFKRPVCQGTILRFEIGREAIGSTSIRYGVVVYRDHIESGEEVAVFRTVVTLVNVDEDGHKQPIVSHQ